VKRGVIEGRSPRKLEGRGDTKAIRRVIEGLCPSIENIFPLPLIKGKGDTGGWGY